MSADDVCSCGCGEARHYPVGLTLVEAELLLKDLGRRRHRGSVVAWSLARKIEHALKAREP